MARSTDDPASAKRATSAASEHIVGSYYRDIDGIPLLDREAELDYAMSLCSSREAIASLLAGLPPATRRRLLGPDERWLCRPRRWPLAELDGTLRRLRGRRDDSPALEEILPRLLTHKRRIDRARDALVLGNVRLVIRIVHRSGFHPGTFLDLVQEGNIGLLEAIDRFEPERGLRFATYAQWWIRRAILRTITDQRRMIAVPVHTSRLIREVHQVSAGLRDELGHEPTAAEIADRMQIDIERVDRLRTVMQVACPLERAPDDGAELPGLLQRLADDRSPDPLESVLDREQRRWVKEAVGTLTPREQMVIRMRFGLEGELRPTLREIGRIAGVSRERVRQIESAALRKIATRLLASCSDGVNAVDRSNDTGTTRPFRLRPLKTVPRD